MHGDTSDSLAVFGLRPSFGSPSGVIGKFCIKHKLDLTNAGAPPKLRHLQPLPRLRHARGRAAKLTRRDARERHELTPAEGVARRGKFVARGAIVFLRVQRAVLSPGLAEHQVEHRTRRVAEAASGLRWLQPRSCAADGGGLEVNCPRSRALREGGKDQGSHDFTFVRSAPSAVVITAVSATLP